MGCADGSRVNPGRPATLRERGNFAPIRFVGVRREDRVQPGSPAIRKSPVCIRTRETAPDRLYQQGIAPIVGAPTVDASTNLQDPHPMNVNRGPSPQGSRLHGRSRCRGRFDHRVGHGCRSAHPKASASSGNPHSADLVAPVVYASVRGRRARVEPSVAEPSVSWHPAGSISILETSAPCPTSFPEATSIAPRPQRRLWTEISPTLTNQECATHVSPTCNTTSVHDQGELTADVGEAGPSDSRCYVSTAPHVRQDLLGPRVGSRHHGPRPRTRPHLPHGVSLRSSGCHRPGANRLGAVSS